MNKYILIILLSFFNLGVFSQAKKPTIMVLPSDNWMDKNGFMMTYENQGKTSYAPDYRAAGVKSKELYSVLTTIQNMLTERNFPPKILSEELKKIESQAAEDAMLTSKSGADINESPIDKLKKTAKADIIVYINWDINDLGFEKSVSFDLAAVDTYTSKPMGGSNGTGKPSMTAESAILLKEAVLENFDIFTAGMQNEFEKLFVDGREIVLRIKTWSSWDKDLESEDFGDDQLSTLIENWVSANTVKGRFNTTDATENMMLLEQVRIPMYDEKGKAIDAKGWANDLRKHLKTLGIESKLMTQGLGQAQLVLGEK
ncbi:MAG: hypothetical protein KA210_06330 [Bacteroidia bacterium]|jgi:hypothetical protein|nr:hypothetical protein [Bacteroidia bacterium]